MNSSFVALGTSDDTSADSVDKATKDVEESLGDLHSDTLPRKILETISALGNSKTAGP